MKSKFSYLFLSVAFAAASSIGWGVLTVVEENGETVTLKGTHEEVSALFDNPAAGLDRDQGLVKCYEGGEHTIFSKDFLFEHGVIVNKKCHYAVTVPAALGVGLEKKIEIKDKPKAKVEATKEKVLEKLLIIFDRLNKDFSQEKRHSQAINFSLLACRNFEVQNEDLDFEGLLKACEDLEKLKTTLKTFEYISNKDYPGERPFCYINNNIEGYWQSESIDDYWLDKVFPAIEKRIAELEAANNPKPAQIQPSAPVVIIEEPVPQPVVNRQELITNVAGGLKNMVMFAFTQDGFTQFLDNLKQGQFIPDTDIQAIVNTIRSNPRTPLALQQTALQAFSDEGKQWLSAEGQKTLSKAIKNLNAAITIHAKKEAKLLELIDANQWQASCQNAFRKDKTENMVELFNLLMESNKKEVPFKNGGQGSFVNDAHFDALVNLSVEGTNVVKLAIQVIKKALENNMPALAKHYAKLMVAPLTSLFNAAPDWNRVAKVQRLISFLDHAGELDQLVQVLTIADLSNEHIEALFDKNLQALEKGIPTIQNQIDRYNQELIKAKQGEIQKKQKQLEGSKATQAALGAVKAQLERIQLVYSNLQLQAQALTDAETRQFHREDEEEGGAGAAMTKQDFFGYYVASLRAERRAQLLQAALDAAREAEALREAAGIIRDNREEQILAREAQDLQLRQIAIDQQAIEAQEEPAKEEIVVGVTLNDYVFGQGAFTHDELMRVLQAIEADDVAPRNEIRDSDSGIMVP